MRSIFWLTTCLIPCCAQAATFQTFDAPGPYGTCGTAIASNGLVAGVRVQPLMVGVSDTAPSVPPKPFLYAAGQFSTPQLSLLTGTVIFTGVNKDRFLTGNAFGATILQPGSSVNFILHRGAVSVPQFGGLPISGLAGITDRGAVLGEVTITKPLGGGFNSAYSYGFLRAADGALTTIDDGSGFATPRATDARADRVVGYSFADTSTGWVFSNGSFTPVGFPGAALTEPAGVDEAGTISGNYLTGDLTGGRATSHGFFLRHGVYKTYDVPRAGVISTVIAGMNEAEQITGCYTDAKGTHGFIRTP